MKRQFFSSISAWAVIACAACVGCSASTSAGVAPHDARTIDRKTERGEEIARALEDNPFAIAAKKKRGTDDSEAAQNETEEKARAQKEADDAATLALAEKNRLAAEAAANRASKALEAKDFEAAAKAANEAISLDPKNYPYAYVILGDVALEAHDYGKALESYRKAMELAPDDAWAASRASQALQKLKRLPEARDVLKKFVDAHPDVDADTLDALAWIEMDLADFKSSESAFERAEKAADGKDAEAWYGLAMLAARRKDAVATQKDLEALFALDPARRIVLERDPTFFRMRLHPGVKALFSVQKMAEAKKFADAKKQGLAVGGGPSLATSNDAAVAKAKAALGSSKLAVPGGAETTIEDRILFAFDSATLQADADSTLDQVADFLKKQASSIDYVEIEGHADHVGDDVYNVKLSEMRAKSVRAALVARGVAGEKLLTKGYGNFCPVDPSDDAKNRRVQFAIASGGKVIGDELTCTEKMRKWLKPEPARKISLK